MPGSVYQCVNWKKSSNLNEWTCKCRRYQCAKNVTSYNWLKYIHTHCSWWFKQPDYFNIKNYHTYAVTMKQNKIAVVNWLFCQSFRVKTLCKYKNILVWMILKEIRKDFMVFQQPDLLSSDLLYLTFLYTWSNVYHNRAKLTRLLCHCFVNLGFPHNTNFAYK